MKSILSAMVCALCAGGALAEVSFSNVTVHQRWPWSAKVDVSFVAKGVDEPVGVRPVFRAGETVIPVRETALSGDRMISSDGCYRLTWNPELSALAGDEVKGLTVSLSASEPPLYLIVDLSKSRGDDGLLQYVWEDDLRADTWGTWEENPYAYISSVIWTGVAADDLYRTNSLVLRWVPATTSSAWTNHTGGADTYLMGAASDVPNGTGAASEGKSAVEAQIGKVHSVSLCQPQQTVKLTKGYWVGVFEVTQAQWSLLGITNNSLYVQDAARRPMDRPEVLRIRGTGDSYLWPAKGHAVDPASFLGRLRAKTGLMFDLPTEAQWEFAARAGATGIRYGEQTYEGLKATARCWWQRWGYGANYSAGDPQYNGTAPVGSYSPNAWGLYDVLGNVAERCLDAWTGSGYTGAGNGGVDPVGAASGSYFCVMRGGEFYNYIDYCTLPGRRCTAAMESGKYGFEGFRVVAW